jgi:hypothetical protein
VDGIVAEYHPCGLNVTVEITSPRSSVLQEDCKAHPWCSSIRVGVAATHGGKQRIANKNMTGKVEMMGTLARHADLISDEDFFIRIPAPQRHNIPTDPSTAECLKSALVYCSGARNSSSSSVGEVGGD